MFVIFGMEHRLLNNKDLKLTNKLNILMKNAILMELFKDHVNFKK